MQFGRRLKGIMLLTIISATVLGMSVVASAYSPTVTLVASETSGNNKTSDVQSSAVNSTSPAGCYGQTDRPHNSSHVPGTVNVVARSKCNSPVPTLYVKTQLFFKDWFLWYAWGPVGEDYDLGVDFVEANSAGSCKPGEFKGDSYHYSYENGVKYEAYTSNSALLTCP